jgi:hypothetical protein
MRQTSVLWRQKKHNLSSKKDQRRALLRRESEIGGRLFGKIPKNHTRSFFCLNQNTWVWYETFPGTDGETLVVNTRYRIYEDTIEKIQNNKIIPMTLQEMQNVVHAMELYVTKVEKAMYKNFA